MTFPQQYIPSLQFRHDFFCFYIFFSLDVLPYKSVFFQHFRFVCCKPLSFHATSNCYESAAIHTIFSHSSMVIISHIFIFICFFQHLLNSQT